MITQQLLKEYFDYDPEGFLIWKKLAPSNRTSKLGDRAGSLDTYGYVCIKFFNKNYKAHRLIFLWHYGHMPKLIDHQIRGKEFRSDNRIENLREATEIQQRANSKQSSKSGYKGVESRNGKYVVRCGRIYVGVFTNPIDAARAYDKKAFELYGEFAHLNFPIS